jgi:hypothetical protein
MFSKAGIIYLRDNLAMPSKSNISQLRPDHTFPLKIFLLNVVAVSIMTIGVLSAVYASYLNPEYRTTASNLSAFINGFATILMFVFIDPHLSTMTDDVNIGKLPESAFRKIIVYMVGARIAGTMLAQILFLPAAKMIAWATNFL